MEIYKVTLLAGFVLAAGSAVFGADYYAQARTAEADGRPYTLAHYFNEIPDRMSGTASQIAGTAEPEATEGPRILQRSSCANVGGVKRCAVGDD